VNELIILGAVSLIINVVLCTLVGRKIWKYNEGKKRYIKVLYVAGGVIITNLAQRTAWALIFMIWG